MAFSGNQVTRLGLYGGPRGLYGSFANKVAAVLKFVKHQGFRKNVGRLMK